VGRENAKNFLKDNPKLAHDIEKAVRSKAKSGEWVPIGSE
jgi:hypothetical protein